MGGKEESASNENVSPLDALLQLANNTFVSGQASLVSLSSSANSHTGGVLTPNSNSNSSNDSHVTVHARKDDIAHGKHLKLILKTLDVTRNRLHFAFIA